MGFLNCGYGSVFEDFEGDEQFLWSGNVPKLCIRIEVMLIQNRFI